MEWEQTASICSMISSLTAMLSAIHGGDAKSFGVVDFMPPDSVSWLRKPETKIATRGITDPVIQASYLKQAFGFR